MPPVRDDVVEQIMRKHDVPEVVARLLDVRRVAPEGVEAFLRPTLARDFPDPLSLAGMDGLADELADAIMHKRPVAVFGDFDVDGATSTAILVRFFRHFGMDVPFYIPDRMVEGYGPNIKALSHLKAGGAALVILVDCGITAFEVIEQARGLGLDIAVLDHHEAEDKLPHANHVINPKRKDCRSGLDMLAACGVCFMVCVAVNARLRARGYFENNKMREAPLKDWLDLVALGTVCDMVPLTGVNRLFVRAGFARMAERSNVGIAALLDVGRVSGAPNPYHAGFVLGPRINAGSRVHQADLGARLLTCDDPEAAKNIAFTLEDCNNKRKTIQQDMFDQAIAMVEGRGLHQNPLIMVGDESWHPGLAGLVAGRLKERYNKPAVAVAYTEGMSGMLEGRGSGRSVAGVNLGAAFIDARNENLVLKGGGHAMAAGFTIMPDQFEPLRDFLYNHVAAQMAGQVALSDLQFDSILSVHGAKPDYVRMIHEQVGPFGTDHPEPLFAFTRVRVHMADVIGTDHVRCMISDWEGGARLKAVAFRSADTPLGQALLKQGSDTPMHIAGHLKLDSWQGQERVELHIQDAAPCA